MSEILLHVCCGPCATYPLDFFAEKNIKTVGFFYNPNIYPNNEKEERLNSAKKTADFFDVLLIEKRGDYKNYLNAISGKEKNENKERCRACYRLRLAETAKKAKELKINNFTTTLLISPYQDIEAIKEIGEEIAKTNDLKFYFKDFRPEFQTSRKMAKELGLYRQKYCGCEFSKTSNKG